MNPTTNQARVFPTADARPRSPEEVLAQMEARKINPLDKQAQSLKTVLDDQSKPVSPDMYRQKSGYEQIKPLARLSKYKAFRDQPQYQEEVPLEIATILYNHAKTRLLNTYAHAIQAIRNIRTVEDYWRSRVGSDTGLGNYSFDTQIAAVLFRKEHVTGRIPHHTPLVEREGRMIQGVLGRVPNSKQVAFDPENDHHVESASAAQRIHASLQPTLAGANQQLMMLRRLWTAGIIFIRINEVDSELKLPMYTYQPYEQVQVPGITMCVACNNKSEFAPMTPPPEIDPNAPETTMTQQGVPGTVPPDIAALDGQVCPYCGVMGYFNVQPPIVNIWQVPTPMFEFTGQEVALSTHDHLTITTPVLEEFKDLPWLMVREHKPISNVITMYPHLRANWRTFESVSLSTIDSSKGSSPFDLAGTVRNTVGDMTSRVVYRNGMVEVTEFYLKPGEYYCMQVDQEGVAAEWMSQRFPEGAKLTYIQGKLVEISHARLDREFVCLKADRGSGMYQMPQAGPTVAANRIANLATSLVLQAVRALIPIKLFRGDVISQEAISNSATGLSDWIKINAGEGLDLKNLVYQTEAGKPPTGLTELLSYANDYPREINGTNDTIAGNANIETTLGSDELRLNRALAYHHPLWEDIRRAWSLIYTNVIRQIMDKALVNIEIPNSQAQPQTPGQPQVQAQPQTQKLVNENIVIGGAVGMPCVLRVSSTDIEKVRRGGWYTHVEESIPVSQSQITARLIQILGMGPEFINIVLGDPRNKAKLIEYLLPPGMFNADLDAFNRIKTIIGKLKSSPPPQPVMDQFGQAIPAFDQTLLQYGIQTPAASMPILPDELDPGLCYGITYSWLQTAEAQDVRGKEQDPSPYYLNVVYWMKANKALVDFQMQQAQMQQDMQNEKLAAASAGKGSSSKGSKGGNTPPEGQPEELNGNPEPQGNSELNINSSLGSMVLP